MSCGSITEGEADRRTGRHALSGYRRTEEAYLWAALPSTDGLFPHRPAAGEEKRASPKAGAFGGKEKGRAGLNRHGPFFRRSDAFGGSAALFRESRAFRLCERSGPQAMEIDAAGHRSAVIGAPAPRCRIAPRFRSPVHQRCHAAAREVVYHERRRGRFDHVEGDGRRRVERVGEDAGRRRSRRRRGT